MIIIKIMIIMLFIIYEDDNHDHGYQDDHKNHDDFDDNDVSVKVLKFCVSFISQ